MRKGAMVTAMGCPRLTLRRTCSNTAAAQVTFRTQLSALLHKYQSYSGTVRTLRAPMVLNDPDQSHPRPLLTYSCGSGVLFQLSPRHQSLLQSQQHCKMLVSSPAFHTDLKPALWVAHLLDRPLRHILCLVSHSTSFSSWWSAWIDFESDSSIHSVISPHRYLSCQNPTRLPCWWGHCECWVTFALFPFKGSPTPSAAWQRMSEGERCLSLTKPFFFTLEKK